MKNENNSPLGTGGHKIKGLLGSLRRAFSLGKAEDSLPKNVSSDPMRGEEDHWVDLTLEEILQRRPELEVHLVSLTQFREAIGSAWNRIGDKAIMLAESTLRKVAGHGNPVRVFGEDGIFLLAFPRLTELEGRRRATEAAIAVGQKLVGARFRIVGDTTGEPLVCLTSGKGGDLIGENGSFLEKMVSSLEQHAVPPSEAVNNYRSETVASSLQHEEDFLTGTAQSDDIDPGWAPLDHSQKEHTIEITSIESDEALQKYSPKWRAIKHKKQQGEVHLVPIEHRRKKKDYIPEWVPIKK